MEIIKNWWKSLDPNNPNILPNDLPTRTICVFIVKKRMAQDKEQAYKII